MTNVHVDIWKLHNNYIVVYLFALYNIYKCMSVYLRNDGISTLVLNCTFVGSPRSPLYDVEAVRCKMMIIST